MNKKILALLLNAGLCGSIAVNPIASAYAAESYQAPISADESVSMNELNDLLPATMEEFTQFKEKYGTVSVHGEYIVYCDDINYSVGNEVVMEQTGTAEIQKIKQYDIVPDEPMPAGSESHTVIVYRAVSKGTVKLSWSQGRPWQWEESKTEVSLNYFTVNEDLSVNEISEEEYIIISTEKGFSYEVKDGSIVFENISKSNSMMSFIISSNSDCDMVCERDKATFSPKEDGRYVLTVVQTYETIFPVGKPENSGHVHYFYPILTSYTVDASRKEINIDKKNCHNYYSEEQITKIRESLADYEYVACSDAEAEGSENLLNETYFSFVNGNMPDTSYITTCYSEYSVESYFCINIPGAYGKSWVKVSDDTLASTMEKMNTSSDIGADDIMDFYMVKALKDGVVTISAGHQLMIDPVMDHPVYNLVIENGVFKRADKNISTVKGDANGDGELTTSDVVMLQKWLIGAGDLTCWENVDLCRDGRIDVFDLNLLKKELINSGNIKKMLTRSEFMEILITNDEYTWSDFEQYKSENIGSESYILKYEIVNEGGEYLGALYLNGESMTEKPQNIYLENTNGEEMDIYKFKELFLDGFFDPVLITYDVNQKKVEKSENNKKTLTESEFFEIFKTKDEYTWSDFEQYKSEDIGSGLYILKYEIVDEDGEYLGALYLSGGSMTEKPQNIYLEDTSGNKTDIYQIKELYLCKFPEVSESNTFDFTSPDGSQHFYVQQNAVKYKDQNGSTTLDFYTIFDHYDLLKYMNITSTDMPYIPFNDNGKWNGNSFTDDNNFKVVWNESSVTFNFTADKEYSLTFDYVDTSLRNQTIRQEINNKEKPEITAVDLTANCVGDLKYRSKIKDAYRVDVMTSGTVGLVGTPIKFTLDENVESANAVFHYNEDELRWVKEENLILMYYSNKAAVQAFKEVEAVIDTEKNTVSFDVKNDGIYLLVDAYEWSNYFGKDTTEFKKNANILAYTSDWERGYDTGDIMNLCDKEWAIANAPDFRVSTPEQLASVVWYVNASGFQCSVTLENDIDLAGYKWVPMGYQPMSFIGNPFSGTIDGNGFAIKNMSISSNLSDVGFIGKGGSEIKNIRFENSYIKGGRNTGIVCGDSKAKFSNVSVSGNIETHKSNCIGAIVGYQASGSFVDCTADVTLYGEPYPHFSYQKKVASETEINETYTISIDENCMLTRNDCGYTSLSWEFYVDGERILSRNAVKSTECNIKNIEFFKKYSGKECTVYLTTYRNGIYVRTSNTLNFILP